MNGVIEGVVSDIFPTETIGNFKKRVCWIREEGKEYPQHFAVEFHGDSVLTLDNFIPGDAVKCNCVVKGRHWQKNEKSGIMVTIKAISMMRIGGSSQPSQPSNYKTNPTTNSGISIPKPPDDNEDLPF